MNLLLKKPLTLAGITATFVAAMPASYAAQIANDPFLIGATPSAGEYVSGSTIVGQNPTIAGFSGAWTAPFNGTNAIQPTSLVYSSPGYTTSGGSELLTNSARIARLFDGTNPFAVADNTVYMSFLLQVNDSSVYKALELNSAGFNDGSRSLQLGVASTGDFPSSTNFGFRVNDNGALTGNLGAFDINAHLFVVKFTLSSAGSGDSVTAWMDPTIVGSGDPTGGVTVSGFDLNATDGLAFAAFGGAGTGTGFDELRLGSTFQDVTVTAVPEPNSAGLIFCGFIGLLIAAKKHRKRAI